LYYKRKRQNDFPDSAIGYHAPPRSSEKLSNS
jgi:hypothetical protein